MTTTRARVWAELEKRSFAVLSHVTPEGEPRSSGVVYAMSDHRLFTAVAPDSWKARQLTPDHRVSVTVPVRRGGVLALVTPIPPATISFQARVVVHAPGSFDIAAMPALEKLLPKDRRDVACIVELVPEGVFLTYGIGVRLMDMIDPEKARARVPVG